MLKVRPQSANSTKPRFSWSRTVDSEGSAEKLFFPKFLKSSHSVKSECNYKLLEQSEALLSAFDEEEEECSDKYRSESEEDPSERTTRIDMKLLSSSTVSKCEGELTCCCN